MQKVIYNKDEGMNVPIKIWTLDYDDNAVEQAKNAARLPFIHKWISLMPDTHPGYGVPIGSVIPCDGYVIPYAVGSDIGCGMSAIPLHVHKDDLDEMDVANLLTKIASKIPVGFQDHVTNNSVFNEERDWDATLLVDRIKFDDNEEYKKFCKMFRDGIGSTSTNQLGTLGGGNHFFELQHDNDGMLWYMVHSGSRNLGNNVFNYHFKIAQDMCRRYHSPLTDSKLAYLPVDSKEGRMYIDHMNVALDYAYASRKYMIKAGLEAWLDSIGQRVWDLENSIINIHHNYAAIENHYGKNVWVHRKGATAARKGQQGIIPGSMCTKSYIVRGKGDVDSFMSCSHGSGRNFGRKESIRRIESGLDPSVEDQLGEVSVYGTNDVRDEVGSSYKNIEDVMKYQNDLVDIEVELTPIAVLKG